MKARNWTWTAALALAVLVGWSAKAADPLAPRFLVSPSANSWTGRNVTLEVTKNPLYGNKANVLIKKIVTSYKLDPGDPAWLPTLPTNTDSNGADGWKVLWQSATAVPTIDQDVPVQYVVHYQEPIGTPADPGPYYTETVVVSLKVDNEAPSPATLKEIYKCLRNPPANCDEPYMNDQFYDPSEGTADFYTPRWTFPGTGLPQLEPDEFPEVGPNSEFRRFAGLTSSNEEPGYFSYLKSYDSFEGPGEPKLKRMFVCTPIVPIFWETRVRPVGDAEWPDQFHFGGVLVNDPRPLPTYGAPVDSDAVPADTARDGVGSGVVTPHGNGMSYYIQWDQKTPDKFVKGSADHTSTLEPNTTTYGDKREAHLTAGDGEYWIHVRTFDGNGPGPENKNYSALLHYGPIEVITKPQITCPPSQNVPTCPGLCNQPPVGFALVVDLIGGGTKVICVPFSFQMANDPDTVIDESDSGALFRLLGGAIWYPKYPNPTDEIYNLFRLGVVLISGGDAPVSGSGCLSDPWIYRLVFKGIDNCGNLSTNDCTWTVGLYDGEAPVITRCPTSVTGLKCPQDVPTPDFWRDGGQGTDNCDSTPTAVLKSDTSAGAGCPGNPLVVTRVWALVDDCLNESATCTQTFTVVDDVIPTITACPRNLSFKCAAEVTPASFAGDGGAGSDNCGQPVTSVLVSETPNGGSGCPGNALIISRVWQVRDVCGNLSTTCTQTITVVDDVIPTITACPRNLNFKCASQVTPADFAGDGGAGTDNCGQPVTPILVSETPNGGNGCPGNALVITRVWQVRDACGNLSTTCSQTVTVVDDVIPTITACPRDLSFKCASQVTTANFAGDGGAGTDNCGQPVTPVLASETNNGGAGCPASPYVITRVWQVRDACGNLSATCTQTVTVVDDVIPEITACPRNLSFKCASQVTPANFAGDGGAGTDNCGQPVTAVLVSETNNGGAGCPASPYVITRVWQVRDACGNLSTTCNQTVTVVDDVIPEITACPRNLSFKCAAEVTPANFAGDGGAGTDNCGQPVTAVLVSETPNSGTGCPGNPLVITRAWQVRDVCGNLSAICTQTVTVIDDVIPTITACPRNLSFKCAAEVTLADFAGDGGAGTDNCGQPVTPVLVSETPNQGSGCPGDPLIITRVWQVRDVCGNLSTTCTQTVTVVDDVIPTITDCPRNLTFKCDNLITPPSFPGDGGAGADNCGQPVTPILVSQTDNGGAGCPTDPLVITRVWQVRDVCGNLSATCDQTVTVIDDVPPELICPDDVTLECDHPASFGFGWLPDQVTWQAFDPSDNSPYDFLLTSPAWFRVTDAFLVGDTWTVTDFGSTILTTAFVGYPEGFGDNPTADAAWMSPLYGSGEVLLLPGVHHLVVTTDGAAGIPAGGFVRLDLAIASDNCDPYPTITFTDVTLISEPGRVVKQRTWVAEDNCGNVSLPCTQLIEILDRTPPDITACPRDLSFKCVSEVTPPNFFGDGGQGVDNCDASPDAELVSETNNGGAGCPGNALLIWRVWRLVDDAGNPSQTCTQTITVIDDVIPTITACPRNLSFKCASQVTPADFAGDGGAGTDNCGQPVTGVLVSETPNQGSGCPGDPLIITRVWQVRDVCGNLSTTCTQTITVIDDVIPEITACPRDLSFKCPSQVTTANFAGDGGAGTDNCGQPVTPVLVSETGNGGAGCPGNALVISRVWQVRDVCGNLSATCTQRITVIDDVIPEITACPRGLSFKCASQVTTANFAGDGGAGIDNCYQPVTAVLVSETGNGGAGCPGNALVISRVWQVRDVCGNLSATCTQTITVIDDVNPEITACPRNLSFKCAAQVTSADFGADGGAGTDNCGQPVIAVLVSETPNSGAGCLGDPLIITRVWQVRDVCGNLSTTCTQTITVIDDVIPTITACPRNLSFKCPSQVTPADFAGDGGVGTDNCGQPVTAVLVSETPNQGSGCPGDPLVITREWRVLDACGNESTSCTQTITVVDDVIPEITACPRDLSFKCASQVTPANFAGDGGAGTDNCGQPVYALLVSETNNGGAGCPGNALVISRVWQVRDVCGNLSATCTQTITVIDDVIPEITACPRDLSFKCASQVTTANFAGDGGAGIDNCGQPVTAVLVSETGNGGAGCPGNALVISRVWQVRDVCGNLSATCTQTITVIDDVIPEITACPRNLSFKCASQVTAPDFPGDGGAGIDNCGQPVTAVLVSETPNGGAGCPSDPLIITRVWQVRDVCGNLSATCTQTITVIDDVLPGPQLQVRCPGAVGGSERLLGLGRSGRRRPVLWRDRPGCAPGPGRQRWPGLPERPPDHHAALCGGRPLREPEPRRLHADDHGDR